MIHFLIGSQTCMSVWAPWGCTPICGWMNFASIQCGSILTDFMSDLFVICLFNIWWKRCLWYYPAYLRLHVHGLAIVGGWQDNTTIIPILGIMACTWLLTYIPRTQPSLMNTSSINFRLKILLSRNDGVTPKVPVGYSPDYFSVPHKHTHVYCGLTVWVDHVLPEALGPGNRLPGLV